MKEIQRPAGPAYDLEATREKFLASGRKFRPWAILKGLNPESFARMMDGSRVPVSGGEVERKFLAALQADGLLVLKKKTTRRKASAESAAV